MLCDKHLPTAVIRCCKTVCAFIWAKGLVHKCSADNWMVIYACRTQIKSDLDEIYQEAVSK